MSPTIPPATDDPQVYAWVLSADLQDRPGAVTRVVTQFSTRGISVDVVTATSAARNAGGTVGRVQLVFTTTTARARLMARIVQRLADSTDVEVRRAVDAPLVAVLRARIADPPEPTDPRVLRLPAADGEVVASGGWVPVDTYAGDLTRAGATDVQMTILT